MKKRVYIETEDDVIKELHAIKDAIAAKYGYDVRAVALAMKRKYEKKGRKLVRPPKRAKA